MAEPINRLPDPQQYDDPIQFLRAAHAVIIKELDLLKKLLTDVQSQGLAESFRTKSEWLEIFHFFTNSVGQHEEDEEEALFPYLRERVPKLGFQLPDAPIHFLTQGHNLLRTRVEELVKVWRGFQKGESLEATHFIAAGYELNSLYKDHIAMEEKAVYQPANEVLSPMERVAIMDTIQSNHSKSRFMEAPQFERPTVSGNYDLQIVMRRRSNNDDHSR
ncbi:MAG TPA: hemerythrin domain-containing protein [Candidatus Kapabacteria bacterium]|nr:hemerythrin domain-containing protein [Candidatus Kapabacteria bacterium]